MVIRFCPQCGEAILVPITAIYSDEEVDCDSCGWYGYTDDLLDE